MRFALPILMLMPAFLPAQNISASLSGVIEDSAGARVPAVEVTLTSQQGFVRTMKTNAEGYFSFPDLTPGMYALTATVPGFRKHIQPDIELSSSLVRMLPAIRLQVGEIAESVTVTADAAPVQLGSSDRAGTLSSEDLQTIALRGRDFMDVVGLLPGVVDTADSREAPTEASTRGIYILGGRTTAKNITVDGVTNVDTSSNQEMHNAPSMDSISEVKVLMSNYSAEYGRNAGGSVNIITRGGGRQFHGSASWYHRHESYSANEWFNNANRVSRPRYRYNIPGYTVGGPVYIPRVWNTDRTRLFFFFSQEFQRQLQDYGTRKVTVPSALQREGDFSQTFDLNGRLTTVWDPLNNRTAFPGNVIPKSRFDPVGRKVLDLFPLPNFADPNPVSRYQWNFIAAQSGPFPRHSEIVRFDFAPRQNMQMNVRYTNTKSEAHPPWGNWVNGSVNFPLTATVLRRPGRGATVRNTTTLSATVFSEFTFGFSQFENFYGPEFPERVSRQGTGINIPQWNPKLNPQGFLPNMTFTSVPNYANPSMSNPPYYGAEHIYSLVENLSKIAGTHTFKAGVYLEWLRDDVFANSLVRGAISFNRDTNNPLDTNYAYSNALMGIYQSYSEANARPPAQFRYTDVHFYVQDAWRISRRLMIDYGLRISRVAPAYEKSGTSSTFVPDLWDPARAPVLLRPALNERNVKVALDPTSGKTYSQALIGTYAPGVGDPATGMALAGTRGLPKSLYTVAPVSFAPRLGFAFDPFGRGRTALRGGAGVFYDRVQINPITSTDLNPPVIYTPKVYFGTIAALAETSGQGILAPTSSMSSLLGRQHTPATYSYSFGIQHQLSRSMFVDISYVGSVSRHLFWRRNLNAVPIGSTQLEISPWNRDPTARSAYSSVFLRPYLGLGDILHYELASTSNYNSLQCGFNRRLQHGVMFGASYTFGKALGSAATDTTNISPFFAPRHRNYGPLTYDRSQVLSLRYTWVLPKPGKRLGSRAIGAVTDGWEVAGTSRFMTGAPFTPGYSLVSGVDVTGTPSEGARIQVLDPAAPPETRFGAPPKYTFGNAGVAILRGPGVNNWDISAYRTIRVRERASVQLRLETYNTFNHPQWGSLNTTARFDQRNTQIDPSFLDPRTSRGPRRVQIAARVSW